MRSVFAKWCSGALVLLGLALACGESGVVGGKCRAGLLLCDGRCIDPNLDEDHCGACNNRCEDAAQCTAGVCEPGGAGSGGTAAGAAGEAGAPGATAGSLGGSGGTGTTRGSGGSGGTGATGGVGGTQGGTGGVGGSTGGASAGGSGGGPACDGPLDVPEQCGDCDTVCDASAPLCAPNGGNGYGCVSACPGSLVRCQAQCVDLMTHPRNCGRCNNVCASGVCIDGVCAGATAGHVIYACMNYQQVFATSAQVTLLGNAVYLTNRDPVRVLAYSEHARSAVMNSTDRAIERAGADFGRTSDITREADLSVIESEISISNYDVFLVYDQSQAPSGELAAAGAQLASALDEFARAGGVVLMLSGGSGVAEMGEFSTSTGLLDVGLESDWTGEIAYNQASGDAVGIGVVTPFATLPLTCTFETAEMPSANTVYVVTDTNPSTGVGLPIVVHKTVTP